MFHIFLVLVVSCISNTWAQNEIARGVCRSLYLQVVTRCPITRTPFDWQLSIRLLRQISFNPCIPGRTFGLTPDNAYIWVTGLCHAEFSVATVVTSSPPAPPSYPTISGNVGAKDFCGVPNLYRIIGGANATACQYPWMVMVVNPVANISCGGAILGPRHVMTASHCFFSVNKRSGTSTKALASQVVVLSGSSSMPFDSFNIPGLRVRNVDKILTHEGYNWKTLANDIAIVKLAEPIQYNNCHRPICLSSSSKNIQQATNCRAMGWGVSSNQPGANAQAALQWISLPVVSDGVCRKKYRSYASPSTFCAGGQGKDTCKGDSGGPFVCSEPDQRYYAYGVVSAGLDSQCGNSVGLYTKVSSYLPWINKQMEI